MVQPSQAWLDKFNDTIVPEMFLRITYSVTEPGLQDDALPSTNGEVPFSTVESITSLDDRKAYAKYGTGEPNLTILDGSELIPDLSAIQDAGYISESVVSSSNSPVVTFSFSELHKASIPGVIITWSNTFNEWATDFVVTARNGSTVVAEKVVAGNDDVTTEVELEIANYNSISITVKGWCIQNRRARIEQVQLGGFVIFTKNQVLSYEHESERDPISGQLPKDSISFSIDNSNQTWNPLNPEGMFKYLYERQPISVEYGMDIDGTIEWIDGGQYFLSEWSVPANGIEASFKARDAFSYLMTSQYTGRMYGTLYQMAYDALELIGESVATFRISNELKNYSADITKEDKGDYKNSDILQMVANAAGMALYQTRDSVIVIDRIPDIAQARRVIAGEITELNNYKYPETEFASPIKNVTVTISKTSGSETVKETVSYPQNATGSGATQTVTNPVVGANVLEQNKNILTEAYKVLSNRRLATLEYRASPHYDALDFVRIHHQFGYSSVLLTTRFVYKYTGSFRGTVTGYMLEGI